MKIKLLLAFVVFSLISCSDDDTSPSQPEKNLEQMVVTHYPDGINSNSYEEVYDFDAYNRLTQISYFSPENELSAKKTYEYDQMLLSVIKGYGGGMGDPEQPTSVTSFNYDGSLRIIGMDSNVEAGIEAIHTITSFTYNADNTISAQQTTSAPPEEDALTNFTYYKNADGRIVKKEDADNTIWTQAVYNGSNVQSYTQLNLPSMSYMFNTVDAPKGQYLNIGRNKFDGSFNNTIIAEGFAAVSNGVNKYVSQHTSSIASINLVVTYTYEFDEDGYPIKVSLFSAGSSQPYEVREISYQQ
jgi:hypothetical protein